MFRGRYGLKAAGIATLGAILPLIIFGCGPKPANEEWPAGKPKVMVSFAPLYCFAANVAGEDATVKNVMTTTGPHDFDPTTRDVQSVTKAELFFVVGIGLDEAKADTMKKGSGNTSLKIIKLGEFDDVKSKLVEGQCNHADHKNDPNHKHDLDPHVWLSPDHAILMVNHIRDELQIADPTHATGYAQRASAYVKKLEELKTRGQAMFKDKKDNRLVTFHDSLGYFASCFNLEIRGVLTSTPGKEPNAQEMKKLIRICADETKPTRIIAVEPQYSTSTSGEALKKELVAKGVDDPQLVEIDTLETVKPDDLKPDWYEKKLEANLKALAEKLK